MTAFVKRDPIISSLTVCNLPDEVHRALRLRAAQHGRSTEAEVREILAQSVRSADRLYVGTELRRCAEQFGGVELDLRRAPAPIEPASFEGSSSTRTLSASHCGRAAMPP